ncbi:cilia- and flagella-associated protein 73 [Eurytemora carolleeae]|uniref:cilia- and flagella-associated protein 73 n=1 Tax=Eurytemora carolleeae TaxID=1294199 RepID=UPI000C78A3D0|nr:cilia- and flagella-associated protein 73 [Eurytemora carolleeae]|eukprot:XP_023340055.1 cilia- and flagella-associated protein 73-like [Eurytemora affinis]
MEVQDDISGYFGWRSNIEQNELPDSFFRPRRQVSAKDLHRRLSINKSPKKEVVSKEEVPRNKIPQNREVDLINKWKEMDTAEDELKRTRVLYQKKMMEFQARWRKIEAGQLEVKQNLVKFNNFVREKQGKVEGGLEKAHQEILQQEMKTLELAELEKEKVLYEEAKNTLETAVEDKKVFLNYLQSVVDIVPETFPDIRRLMERCQALVATRDKLRARLSQIEKTREEEARSLEKFSELRMEGTLDYNVRLAELQQNAAKLAARTLERRTILENIIELSKEKKLLISNIKLAISNMHRYVLKRAVVVPGAPKETKTEELGVPEQLNTIIAHIEDLTVVNERVKKSDLGIGYLDPLASEASELRIDY